MEAVGKTKEEIAHLNWVASLGCVICDKNTCVHHIRKCGEPKDHFKTIPLCWYHHQGSEGLHTLGKKAWSEMFGYELDFLKQIQELKNEQNIQSQIQGQPKKAGG